MYIFVTPGLQLNEYCISNTTLYNWLSTVQYCNYCVKSRRRFH